jgi:rSAM/selenodomain-associated transferase 1
MHESLPVFVFAKPPLPGLVKTRMAPTIGAARAAELAEALLRDTLACLPREDVTIATTDPSWFAGFGTPAIDQGTGQLGARLERVLRPAIARAGWAAAVGADTPGLPLGHLSAARALLADNEAVLGPTRDGGYWLIGLRRCPEGLLSDLPWSQANTMEATAERLRAWGLTTALAPTWFDVDEPEDLDHLARLHESGDLCAPHTWEVMKQCGW